MHTAIRITCLSLGSAGMITLSPAAVIFSDNFDGYADQTAFEAAWTAIGTVAPTSATLATDQAVSGLQSIRVDGTGTTGQQRNEQFFSETGTVDLSTVIVFSFDFYDSNAAAAPYRQFSEMRDGGGTGTGQLIAMGLFNNQLLSWSGGNFFMARILGYTPTVVDPDGGPDEGGTPDYGTYFKLNDFANSPLRTTGWHNLQVMISSDDGASADFEFYVDGIFAERVSNVGTAATLRSYDAIRLGSGVSNAGNAAWYDNFRVEIVPEPSAVGLCLLGAAAALGRRRR